MGIPPQQFKKFSTKEELRTYLQKYFPSYYLTDRKKRTMLFTCKYYDSKNTKNRRAYRKGGTEQESYTYKSNRLSMEDFYKSNLIKRNFCESTISLGELKMENLYYLKKITPHRCGLNLEEEMKDGMGILLNVSTGGKNSEKFYKAPVLNPSATAGNLETIGNTGEFFTAWLSDFKEGRGRVGDYLSDGKFRYETVYFSIRENLEKEFSGCMGVLFLFGRTVFIMDEGYDSNGVVENDILYSRFPTIAFLEFKESSENNFIRNFNDPIFITGGILNEFIKKIYAQEDLNNENFLFIMPTLYQNYAHEFNILNLKSKVNSCINYKNNLFFSFELAVRKPVYEIFINRREVSRTVNSYLEEMKDAADRKIENDIGYTIEIIGWLGDNQRKTIAFAAGDGRLNYEIFKNFMDFVYAHLNNNNLFYAHNLEFTEEELPEKSAENINNNITFIVPSDHTVLALVIAYNIPYFISTNSICEKYFKSPKFNQKDPKNYAEYQKRIEVITEFYKIANNYTTNSINNSNIILNTLKVNSRHYLINNNRNNLNKNKRLFWLNNNKLKSIERNFNSTLIEIESTINSYNSLVDPIQYRNNINTENIKNKIDLRIRNSILNSNISTYVQIQLLKQLLLSPNRIFDSDGILINDSNSTITNTVDLNSSTCTCLFYNTYLIPCIHALYTIEYNGDTINNYISTVYLNRDRQYNVVSVGKIRQDSRNTEYEYKEQPYNKI